MTIGERIQTARKNAGLKQSELAGKIGVSVVTIGQYERNKRQPRLEQLERIAEALDIPFRDFFPKEQHEIMDYMYLAGFEERAAEDVLETVTQDDDLMKIYTLSLLERNLLSFFSQLNPAGQQKAVERVEELTEIPKYQKQTPSQDE